jgi:hypothetical protein
VEANSLTVWAMERQNLSDFKFILPGFRFRKSSSPRFFSGGSSTEGPPSGLSVFIVFVLIIVTKRDILIGLYFIHVLVYHYILYNLLRVVINTSVLVGFILLLSLNCYTFSLCTTVISWQCCVTQIHDPV